MGPGERRRRAAVTSRSVTHLPKGARFRGAGARFCATGTRFRAAGADFRAAGTRFRAAGAGFRATEISFRAAGATAMRVLQ